MTLADKLAAILTVLFHVAPFIYLGSLIAVLALYKKWSFVPIFVSCLVGAVGVVFTIKPGGWGFQYLASPWVFALWGSLCLLIAIVVHFRIANELALFYVSFSLTMVLIGSVLAGMFATRILYNDDRRFWDDAAASDAYQLDSVIYQRHLSKAGKDQIGRLKNDNCRSMSKEFVSLLFGLGVNVESCTNAADEVTRFYNEKHMVRDANGALKKPFKLKDANILVLDMVVLDAEYQKLDFHGVTYLCAEVVRHNRNKTKVSIKLSSEVVEHELANLANETYDEAQVRKEIDEYLSQYLEMLAVSATTGAQVSQIYEYIEDLKRKVGKDALGWKYRIPVDAIIENANTPDDLFYPLLDQYIAGRNFGFVSEVVAHSDRLSKDRLIDYAKHSSAEVRIAALTNKLLSEDEIYALMESEKKEDVILAGLANVAVRGSYDLERLIERFKRIKWRLGGGDRSSPVPVLAALIRAGYEETWIYWTYLYKTKDRQETIKFISGLDATKKIRFIEGKYGSYLMDGHQYLLNYLENDPDPEVAKRAKKVKALRYRL